MLSSSGMSSRTTLPPSYHSLFRRENDLKGQYLLIAPDKTCGYISGRPGAVYSCGANATCGLLSLRDGNGAVACCNTVDCNLKAGCVDFNGYFSSSACVDGCEVDAYTLKCTNTAAPYCNTISFSGGIQDFWCNNVNISTAQAASTTYKGQPDDRNFSTVALADLITEISFASTGSINNAASINGDFMSDRTADATTSGTSTPQMPDGGDSNTPVGAIVGGVAGGVVAIGLAGLAAFFILRQKKQQKVAATTAPMVYQTPLIEEQHHHASQARQVIIHEADGKPPKNPPFELA
ncbi:hypothetical protein ACKAV7_014616 [Fusarium commune]